MYQTKKICSCVCASTLGALPVTWGFESFSRSKKNSISYQLSKLNITLNYGWLIVIKCVVLACFIGNWGLHSNMGTGPSSSKFGDDGVLSNALYGYGSNWPGNHRFDMIWSVGVGVLTTGIQVLRYSHLIHFTIKCDTGHIISKKEWGIDIKLPTERSKFRNMGLWVKIVLIWHDMTTGSWKHQD